MKILQLLCLIILTGFAFISSEAKEVQKPKEKRAAMNYEIIKLHFNLKTPVRFLAIADTHLIYADGRDNKRKFELAQWRRGAYEFTNIGRNLPYFLNALLYARKNCDLLLHCGDLLDFASEQNMEICDSLMELSGVDYFMVAGNHEYCVYGGHGGETPEEKAWAKTEVPKHFKNNINMDSRIVKGINLIALNNTGREPFTKEYLEFFEKQAAKGLPMILMIHIPLYTKELHDIFVKTEPENPGFLGTPKKDGSVKLSKNTIAFIERIKKEPLLKAVIAGHSHGHKTITGNLAPGLPQIVLGGGYYGCGAILEID